MAKMDLKLKIVQYDPQSRTYTFQVYTPALEKIWRERVWPEKCKLLISTGHAKTEQEALLKALETWPVGAKWVVTDYNEPPLQGEALHKYLIANGPGDGKWLAHLEKCHSEHTKCGHTLNAEVEYTVSRGTKGELQVSRKS